MNDAPVLAQADMGAAMGAGAAIAIERASPGVPVAAGLLYRFLRIPCRRRARRRS